MTSNSTASSMSRRRGKVKRSKSVVRQPHANNRHGKELRRRRKELSMTQSALGRALGTRKRPVPVATISRWELGGTIEHPGMLFLALDELKRRYATSTPLHDEPE